MTNDQIQNLIESLQRAIRVCHEVDSMSDDYERSYPYATGYSRATMQEVVEKLTKELETDHDHDSDFILSTIEKY